MTVHITQLLHAALLVQDLEKARHFYGEVLGLIECHRPLDFPGAWYQIGNQQLHLIVATDARVDQIASERWGRNRHLAFAVTDLKECQQHLQMAGCTYQLSRSGRSALFVCDSDGNLIELSQVHG
ncbi:MAG: glyoxalase [Acaryochloris sp. RU_4_1]|nr:glyoxalase [Acaryochloris sp. RU_4_1]NJR57347.1 glyoxalase [Acaryochloris sp. CRU_2_0]